MDDPVTVRFYGALNELVAPSLRGGDAAVPLGSPRAVKDLVESLGVPHVEVQFALVDGDVAGLGRVLRGGERVAVFPHLDRLPPPDGVASELPSDAPRFLLDGHLGRLAAYLRALGIDAARDRDAADDAIAARADEEDRIVLSRDVGLLKRAAIRRGRLVRSTDPRAQLAEIVRRYGLAAHAAPFTRCLRCNVPFETADAADVRAAAPPRVLERHSQFRRCPRCGGLFWRGTHHGRIARVLESAVCVRRDDPPAAGA